MKEVIKFILTAILVGVCFWGLFWLVFQVFSAIIRTVAVFVIMLICAAFVYGK